MVVRPFTLPDLTIERMCPCTVASLKRTGSMTVAVNLSPARDSLLDSVSFKRTFKLVPGATTGGVIVDGGVARRRRGFLRCPLAMTGMAIRIESTIKNFNV